MKRSSNFVNLYKLKKELHYYPSWYKDKGIFLKLLKKSYFVDEDIINFGRIYVRYNHLKNLKELNKYLNYILRKMELDNPKNLFKKTKQIYNDRGIKLHKNQHSSNNKTIKLMDSSILISKPEYKQKL